MSTPVLRHFCRHVGRFALVMLLPLLTVPFAKAVRIVTHDRQTFYNVCHHPFLDREGGRFIHFEGTYTHDFSGNPEKTPRYNYNQILYRLDLDAAGLHAARVK